MQSDAYTRIMLSLIAVLLAVIAARHFAGDPGKPAPGADPARYQVTNTRIGRALTAIRIDRTTGEVWRLRTEEGELRWEPIAEDGALPPAGEADAAEGGAAAAGAGAEGAGGAEAGAESAAGASERNAGKPAAPAAPQQGP